MATKLILPTAGYDGVGIPATLLPPATPGVAMSAAELAKTAANDAHSFLSTTERPDYPQHTFLMSTGGVDAPTSLALQFIGYGLEDQTNVGRAYLYIYNYNTLSWDELAHNAATEDTLLTATISADFTNYVAADGTFYMAVMGNSPLADGFNGYLYTNLARAILIYPDGLTTPQRKDDLLIAPLYYTLLSPTAL